MFLKGKAKRYAVYILGAIMLTQALSHSYAISSPRTLIERNPFLPPGYDKNKKPKPKPKRKAADERQVRNLELRSIVKYNDVWSFSIYDKTARTSRLVDLNDAKAEYHVVDYDQKTGKVSIKTDSGTIELEQYTPDHKPQTIIKQETPAQTNTNSGNSNRRRRVVSSGNKSNTPKKKVYEMNTEELSKLFPPGHNKTDEELQRIIDNAKKAHERQQEALRNRKK